VYFLCDTLQDWLGDINTDFIRRSGHANYVKDFVDERHFIKAWDSYHIDFTHYQETGNGTHTSTVDHIFWNEDCHESIIDAGVVHIPENISDHCPIYCIVDIGQIKTEAKSDPIRSAPKPSWKKASQEQKTQFKSKLKIGLSSVIVPESLSSCHDVHCDNPGHSEDADNVIVDILECVERIKSLKVQDLAGVQK
jgi:hypothetical protein